MSKNNEKLEQEETEADQLEQEIDETSKLEIAGRGTGRILSWIKDKIVSGWYKTLAFLGNTAKAFLFGDPKATNNFWGDVKDWMDAKTYSTSGPTVNLENKEPEQNSRKKEEQAEQDQETKAKDKEIVSQDAGTEIFSDNSNIQDTADKEKPEQKDINVTKKQMVKVNSELIKFGYGCAHIQDNEFGLAAIDEQGHTKSDLYSVQSSAFAGQSGCNEIGSLSAAIFQIERSQNDDIMEDKRILTRL